MQRLFSGAKRVIRQRLAEHRFPYERYMRRHRCVFVHIPKTAGTSLRLALGAPARGRNHLPWWVYYQANASRFASYFSFAFVRDPAERVLSAYRYLLRGGNQADDLGISQRLSGCGDFDEFIKKYLVNGSLKNHPLFWPQAWFVADHFGNIRVDFLGRVEDIATDYESVRERLRLNVSLPQENTAHEPAIGQISSQARSLIRHIYSEDYELFNYD